MDTLAALGLAGAVAVSEVDGAVVGKAEVPEDIVSNCCEET